MVGGIALILFAILLRFCGLLIIPLILGIVGLIMAFSSGSSKQPEPDPWEVESEAERSGNEADVGTVQYEYDSNADKYFQ